MHKAYVLLSNWHNSISEGHCRNSWVVKLFIMEALTSSKTTTEVDGCRSSEGLSLQHSLRIENLLFCVVEVEAR